MYADRPAGLLGGPEPGPVGSLADSDTAGRAEGSTP
jgi:hypothetical protein